MSLQDWGSLGELVAGIATIVTLIYLAIQIRHNTRSVRSSAFQDSAGSLNELNILLASDPAVSRIFRLGSENAGTLTVDEEYQFNMMCLALFRVYENMYYQSERGPGNDLWDTIGQDISIVMKLPGVEKWWSENPYSFTAGFPDFVNAISAR